MGDPARFDQKWDFRRKETSSDDSSTDGLDSNSDSDSSHEPLLKKAKGVSQGETAVKFTAAKTTLTGKRQAVKFQQSRGNLDIPETSRRGAERNRKPHGKENVVETQEKTEEPTGGGSQAGDNVMDGVGAFMEKLFDELRASREALLDLMESKIRETEEKAASVAPGMEKKKRGRPRRDRGTMVPGGERVKPRAEPASKKKKNGQEGRERAPRDVRESPKSVVLALPSENSPLRKGERSYRRKKNVEADATTPNSSPRTVSGAETLRDLNSAAPTHTEPVISSLLSFFPSNQQELPSLTSNNIFQTRPESLTPDPTTLIQTGHGFPHRDLMNLKALYHNNCYFPGFPVPFPPPAFNFQAQLSSEASPIDNNNNNLFGGMWMSGGALRFSGESFPVQFSGAGGVENNPSENRESPGIQAPSQPQNDNNGGNGSMFQN